jgi:hypothetical protein
MLRSGNPAPKADPSGKAAAAPAATVPLRKARRSVGQYNLVIGSSRFMSAFRTGLLLRRNTLFSGYSIMRAAPDCQHNHLQPKEKLVIGAE